MLAEELKVGDKVIIYTRFNQSIGTVTEITKANNIRVGNSLYNSYGKLRGSDIWSYNFILKATDEDIKEVNEKETINRCLNKLKNLKTITYEQALEIDNILGI